MILTFDELAHYRRQLTLVDGAFDPLHAGHLEYFKKAKGLRRPLLCNLASDAYIQTKHPVLLPASHRLAVVDALRDVSFTHLCESDTETVLEQLRPYAYVKGKDWQGRLPQVQIDLCKLFGIRIVFLETAKVSSTQLLQAVIAAAADRPTSASR